MAGALDAAGDLDGAVAISTRALEIWRAHGEPELPSMVDALVVRPPQRAVPASSTTPRNSSTTHLRSHRRGPGPHLLTSIALTERARIDQARGGESWRHQLFVLAAELRAVGAIPALADWVDREAAALEPERAGAVAPIPVNAASPGPSGGDGTVTALVVDLTERERTILELLASHLSFPEIGGELHISRHTVKSHVRHVYEKLGASSRSEAVRIARNLGLLPTAR